MRDRILSVVRESPKTVPEIATELGSPVHEVMYWVMAARKYGYLEESKEPNDDDYYQYGLVDSD